MPHRMDAHQFLSAALAGVVSICVSTATVAAATPPGFINPGDIDRAIADFTGAGIGQPGGAIRPVDQRLRLASCPDRLLVNWHGRPGHTVRVGCPGAAGWQIYVSLMALPQKDGGAPAVKRGDKVAVVVRGRGFTIRQSGIAQAGGRIGEWIAISLPGGSKPVSARIERPGLAAVESY